MDEGSSKAEGAGRYTECGSVRLPAEDWRTCGLRGIRSSHHSGIEHNRAAYVSGEWESNGKESTSLEAIGKRSTLSSDTHMSVADRRVMGEDGIMTSRH